MVILLRSPRNLHSPPATTVTQQSPSASSKVVLPGTGVVLRLAASLVVVVVTVFSVGGLIVTSCCVVEWQEYVTSRPSYLLNWYSLSTFVQTVSESSVQDSDEEIPESYK